MDTQDYNLSESPEQVGDSSTDGPITAVPGVSVEGFAQDEAEQKKTPSQSRIPEWLEVIWSNRKARAGLIMLACFILVAIFANQLTPYNPSDISFGPSELPSWQHWLG